MVYQPAIPLSTDKQRISQSDIQTNFTELDNLFDVDHVKFSDATGDAGKHAATTFVNRTSKALVIPPVTTAEELAIFVKDDAAGTPRIFYQEPDSAGAGAQIQLSGNLVDGTTGECALPGGLSLKWGQAAIPSSAVTAFTYAGLGLTAFGTATYSLVMSGFSASQVTSSRVTAMSATGFSLQVNASPGTYPIVANWIAIGK